MSQRDQDKRPQPKSRGAFRHFTLCDTRWRDNDRYGHLNNAVYYELFDSAINQLLIDHGLLDFDAGDHVFLVASSGCHYFSEVAYPDKLEIGLAISRLGNSAVTYDLGLFKKGADHTAATGFFVHVHVTRDSYRPVPIPPQCQNVFKPFVIAD